MEKLRRGEQFHASGLLRKSTLVPGLDPDEGGEVLGVELSDIGLDEVKGLAVDLAIAHDHGAALHAQSTETLEQRLTIRSEWVSLLHDDQRRREGSKHVVAGF